MGFAFAPGLCSFFDQRLAAGLASLGAAGRGCLLWVVSYRALSGSHSHSREIEAIDGGISTGRATLRGRSGGGPSPDGRQSDGGGGGQARAGVVAWESLERPWSGHGAATVHAVSPRAESLAVWDTGRGWVAGAVLGHSSCKAKTYVADKPPR